MTGDEIVTAARSYLGVPFRHAGRNRQGVDCVGLLVLTMHDLGIGTEWDDVQYSRVVNPDRMRAEIDLFCDPVETMEAGDVLLFSIKGSAQHCGIYSGGDGTMIHAWDSAGKVAEHELTEKWGRRIAGVYRWRALSSQA